MSYLYPSPGFRRIEEFFVKKTNEMPRSLLSSLFATRALSVDDPVQTERPTSHFHTVPTNGVAPSRKIYRNCHLNS